MDTLEVIARQLVLVIQPLKNAFGSTDQFRRLMYRLGWNTEIIPPSYQALIVSVDQAVAAVEALVDNPEIEDVIEVITTAKEVYDAIKGITDSPGDVPDPLAFLNEVKDNLFEILFTDYLVASAPFLYNFFKVIEVIELEHIDGGAGRPTFIRNHVRWDNIPKFFSEPDKIPERVYGWGTPDFDFPLLGEHFLEILNAIGVPARLGRVEDDIAVAYGNFDNEQGLPHLGPEYRLDFPFAYLNINGNDEELGFSILEFPTEDGKMPGLIVQPKLPSEIGAELRIREDVMLRIEGSSNIATLFGMVIIPNGIELRYPFSDGTTLPDFGFAMGVDYAPEQAVVILGNSEATRLQFQGLSFDFGFTFTDAEPEIELGADLKGLALVIAAGESDGFLKSILGDGETTMELPLGVMWSSVHGVKFKGGGGFEVALHPHLNLGPISVEELQIGLRGEFAPEQKLALNLGANLKAELGPLVAVVQGIGFSLNMVFEDDNNAGPFGIDVGFKAPNGVGLSIDSGGLKGGGFLRLDYDKGEYIGALELEYQELFSLKAIGIINTILPDGSEGFSLLIIITAEFNAIQLGFGFTLNGVGGLLGLNRTTKIDVLRAGIKTNTLKSVLFPEDIIANINRIISDLQQIFPPYVDRFIIGPMAKIGWGTPTIISLELGLLIEIPEPRIAILGVLKAVLPEENAPVLKLQVNFLGVFDFENKYISFDASLYDSKLLAFTLTGDMALRISWGSPAVFILSIGGFHPDFREIPSDLQYMQRLTIALLSGDNPRITIETYFAVTSNTVQFGAKVELYAGAAGFSIHGFVGFDVLFQFDPFYFIASIYAGLALSAGGSVLFMVSLSGTLAGPEPWDVKGKASFKILFFKVSVSFHETWGDDPASLPEETVNVLELLIAEVNIDANWEAQIPANNHLSVSLKEVETSDDSLVIHPFGTLMFTQKLVPLARTIEKFGEKGVEGDNVFEIHDMSSNGTSFVLDDIDGQFAPAHFSNLDDTEKLSRKSFEEMLAGKKIRTSTSLQTASTVNKDVEYELSYLRKRRFSLVFGGIMKMVLEVFLNLTKGGAMAKSELSFLNRKESTNAPMAVDVRSEQYAIARKSDLGLIGDQYIANSQMEAFEMYRQIQATDPDLADNIQVVSTYELNTEAA